MNYWLMKSEPETFSIDSLAAARGKSAAWDGVRNYQARNFLRDQMKKGDLVFFYHSSCAIPGIAGVVSVIREAYPDHTAFERTHEHYDPDSDPQQPRWYMVDVKLERKFARIITLEELRAHAGTRLKHMVLLKRGNRLSITPVTKDEWQFINALL
jgi:predicted RNA-binding protein with PUA-like domain